MTTYLIPLIAQPQTVTVPFPNGNYYNLRLIYQFNDDDCWLLDISDDTGNPIVCGIPVLANEDMLAQYGYLGFGCQLIAKTEGYPNANPKWWNLGGQANLYLVT